MGLELSSRASYALRAMLYLGRARDEGWHKGRRIAEETAIPPAYLPQVLGALIRHGIVTSRAGPHGGYAVGFDPTRVSLLAIVEAVDGPIETGVCALRGGPCIPSEPCSMHEHWRGAQSALVSELAECSLADLLADASATRVVPGEATAPAVPGEATAPA